MNNTTYQGVAEGPLAPEAIYLDPYKECYEASQKYLKALQDAVGPLKESDNLGEIVEELTDQSRLSTISNNISNSQRHNGFEFLKKLEELFMNLSGFYASGGDEGVRKEAVKNAKAILGKAFQADSKYACLLLDFYSEDSCLDSEEFRMMKKSINGIKNPTLYNVLWAYRA